MNDCDAASMQSCVDAFLASPGTYPERLANVEVKETHISRVFLTRRFAYKLKKSVRFEFLDFSTLPLRKQACESEFQLNRRLSPDVYLAVVPVCQADDGTFNLGGKGRPVEWLVKMRRLDESTTLASLIENGHVPSKQLSSLATLLASFYAGQAPTVLKSDEYLNSLLSHIESNRSELLRTLPEQSQRISFSYASQTRYVNLLRERFHDRVCDGRIIDGHGDLRPEHIYFERKPQVIDCVEFNAEYRQNDVVDELAFLSMECDRLGRKDVGNAVLQAYFAASNDRPSETLVAFYKCYRASVRAKVAALRGEQTTVTDKERMARCVDSYLHLADRYTRRLGPKLVITVGGLMGSGKSTLARSLGERLSATVLRTDDVRGELYERDGNLDYGEGKYAPEARGRVYKRMFQRLGTALRSTPTVLLDGTFGTKAIRDEAHAAAINVKAQWVHLECVCPASVSRKRVANRRRTNRSASEARSELFERQSADYETCEHSAAVIQIDTTSPLALQVDRVMAKIRPLFAAEERTSRVCSSRG